jgi:hypothetical protein
VSADGLTIVGRADLPGLQPRAAIWRGGGVMLLQTYLAMVGVDLTGWTLEYAYGVSGNGRIVVGSGTHNGLDRAFVADLGPGSAPLCYANCDASTVSPALNIADFGCFLNRFASGSPYANCDNSTASPALNVQDFLCFLNQFAAGCP